MKDLKEMNVQLDEKKKEINNLEIAISELKENYPEISAYELATRDNSNEYIEKIREINKKQFILQVKKSEYEKLLQEKINLEEKSNDEFISNINKIISKHGILNWKDLTTLICTISILQKCDFLMEEDKIDIKLRINNRISENNELINQIAIKVKEPKVGITNKLNIKNKTTSVVAKGKKSTISTMKSDFENSVDKVVKNAKDIYQKFCDSKSEKIYHYLDSIVENINKNIKRIKELQTKENLNKLLYDLEKKFEMKEENKKINDKSSVVKIGKMYRQLMVSNNQEQKETQIMLI